MTTRCEVCKKKIGVSGFTCCDNSKQYCNEHRYEWAHDCTKNKQQQNKLCLEKTVFKLVAQKVEKI